MEGTPQGSGYEDTEHRPDPPLHTDHWVDMGTYC